jgi:SAM-dependent methyltransferase
MTTKMKWDKIYSEANYDKAQAATVLREHQLLLPKKGCGLDLACGLGANALLLAEQGLDTYAFDLSSIAVKKLQQQALQRKLVLHCQQQDIENTPLAKNKFDVIVVSRFLSRDLSCEIMEALKLGGLLFYQTFTQAKISNASPNNPDYLLVENELLDLFSPLKIRYYQEYALAGKQDQGNRNEALFIGQKI